MTGLLDDERFGAPGGAPRPPSRGDGRLLRLGQGRRLPDRRVGGLPRAGGARRAGGRARHRAHDLPRPRRQRRARRRADARGHPLPAAGPSARAAEGDRAGRDGLEQVRPAGARAPQPRGRRRRHAARGLPRRARQRAAAGRARAHGRALRGRVRDLSRAGARGRGVRGVLPRVHARRRARRAGARLAARAAAVERGLPGRPAGDPVGLLVDADAHAAPGLVRRRDGARRRSPRAPAASRSCAGCTPAGRSSARRSTTSR